MNDLAKALSAPSLAERLRKAKGTAVAQPSTGASLRERVATRLASQYSRALLLDVSGSMAEDAGNGRSKLDQLKLVARDFPRERKFCFSANCVEQDPVGPEANTNLANAFCVLKQAKISHVVLVTDGMPDSESDALREAQGLQIDIIYVGPQPQPLFLAQLAQTSGGQAYQGHLRDQEKITAKIHMLLLEHGR